MPTPLRLVDACHAVRGALPPVPTDELTVLSHAIYGLAFSHTAIVGPASIQKICNELLFLNSAETWKRRSVRGADSKNAMQANARSVPLTAHPGHVPALEPS